ncbi:MAG: RipA family octameric membrane protein [Pseudonocardiaceae bacterium]
MDQRDAIRLKLWNNGVTADDFAGTGEKYRTAILEQYKICVEMADRVSARRGVTNTFFLTLNTGVLAAAGAFFNQAKSLPGWSLLPLVFALVGQCVAWYWIVRSYRLLNSGKYAVIAVLEERLPAFAYSRGEWEALGQGQDWRRYIPLSHMEQWIPVLFSIIFLVEYIFVIAL